MSLYKIIAEQYTSNELFQLIPHGYHVGLITTFICCQRLDLDVASDIWRLIMLELAELKLLEWFDKYAFKYPVQNPLVLSKYKIDAMMGMLVGYDIMYSIVDVKRNNFTDAREIDPHDHHNDDKWNYADDIENIIIGIVDEDDNAKYKVAFRVFDRSNMFGSNKALSNVNIAIENDIWDDSIATFSKCFSYNHIIDNIPLQHIKFKTNRNIFPISTTLLRGANIGFTCDIQKKNIKLLVATVRQDILPTINEDYIYKKIRYRRDKIAFI